MAREPRVDYPGAWLHVMVRALARRPLFEGSADVRDFLAGLAAAARRGDLEVHAYAVVTTHAHLLLRSPRGKVSAALQNVLAAYVRRFNRRRDRDGPLLRSRFRSKLVRGDRYWRCVVRYIDANVPDAALLDAARALGLCSRLLYARPRGPAWLTRTALEAAVSRASGRIYDPKDYDLVFGGALSTELRMIVERGVERGDRARDPFRDLLTAAKPATRRWLERNAVLADGRRAGALLAPASLVRDVIGVLRASETWLLKTGRRGCDGWLVVEAALLRGMSGEGQEAIAGRLGVARWSLRSLCAKHSRRMAADPEYARRYRTALDRIESRLCPPESGEPANLPPARIG